MEEIIKLAEEKTNKVYQALKNNVLYNELESDMNFIWECALHKEKQIWDYCISNLYTLALVSQDIRDRMINKMQTGKADEKFKIACSVCSGLHAGPDKSPVDVSFLKQIVEMAISDKSKKVKLFGVYRAGDMKFFELADLIKVEIDKCSDKKLKETISEYHTYYTKGYIIEEQGNNQRRIHFKSGFRSLECNIYDEKKLHEYILEKYKDNEDLRIIYNLK